MFGDRAQQPVGQLAHGLVGVAEDELARARRVHPRSVSGEPVAFELRDHGVEDVVGQRPHDQLVAGEEVLQQQGVGGQVRPQLVDARRPRQRRRRGAG